MGLSFISHAGLFAGVVVCVGGGGGSCWYSKECTGDIAALFLQGIQSLRQ